MSSRPGPAPIRMPGTGSSDAPPIPIIPIAISVIALLVGIFTYMGHEAKFKKLKDWTIMVEKAIDPQGTARTTKEIKEYLARLDSQLTRMTEASQSQSQQISRLITFQKQTEAEALLKKQASESESGMLSESLSQQMAAQNLTMSNVVDMASSASRDSKIFREDILSLKREIRVIQQKLEAMEWAPNSGKPAAGSTNPTFPQPIQPRN